MREYDLVVVGGGASGFFCAIQAAERNPNIRILILEKSKDVLSKVKVSGGGRCNVTHACFDPKELTSYYPRGQKELLGPFNRFLCGDMMDWLLRYGVETKIEEDGRVFPISNSSASIINCFLSLSEKYGIRVLKSSGANHISRNANLWHVISGGETYACKSLVLATGSSPAIWSMIAKLGHKIIDPVPSLFTFKINDSLIQDLAGISLKYSILLAMHSFFA